MALGEPVRYAYRVQPITIYVNHNDIIEKHNRYNVDFEIACDMFDMKDSKGKHCISNPHLINIAEPDVDINVVNPYISHSVVLDEEHYNRLLSVTNTDGNLHRYVGVVEGYAVKDIVSKFNIDLVDTGLCLTENMFVIDGLRKPEVAFDEKRHARYVQSSESFHLKLKKTKNALVRYNIYEPEICKLSYQNLYALEM